MQKPIPSSTSLPIRITLGVVLSWFLSEVEYPGKIDDDGSLEWCAFTVIVVAAPTLGTVAIKGSDRFVGTLLGGIVSIAVCELSPGFGWLMVITAALSFLSVWAADVLNKDYSMKLFVLTFVMIAIGSKTVPTRDIIGVALSRTIGILAGGLLVVLLTLLVWPEAGTTNAVQELRSAVEALLRLQEDVWENGLMSTGWHMLGTNKGFKLKLDEDYMDAFASTVSAESGPSGGADAVEGSSSSGSIHRRLMSIPQGEFAGAGKLPLNTVEDMDEMEDRQDKMIDEVLACLARSEAFAKDNASEIYAGTIRGWPVFLPGADLRWARLGWRLPAAELSSVGNTIRKVVRLYWTLLRNFQEGFDEELMLAVSAAYPPQMLNTLRDGAEGVVEAILEAFPEPGRLKPTREKVRLEPLVGFSSAVKGLVGIGAEQRRNLCRLLQGMGGRGDGQQRHGRGLEHLKSMHGRGEESQPQPPAEHISAGLGPVPPRFPDTEKGHLAKVRWHSFLFQLEKLLAAFVELHEDVDDLLCRLPGCTAAI
uniref:Uncharacterized protein n=1 Tax=Tetraselmis sp. GSL018 TaxID=582737 RepID=A0A061S665_9CHLO|mmetsp:Transcript_20945/g.49971  ORF Transcript_20945/g.49971 Transcript_20945/m.49971 type:complete len:535 (-) Transcript_20945:333-1937(-)